MLALFNRISWMKSRMAIGQLFILVSLFAPTASVWAQQNGSTSKSGFTSRLINLENTSKEPFRFYAVLTNGLKTQRTFNLKADLPPGWTVAFKTEGSQVAAVQVDSAGRRDVSIEISSTPQAKPDTYKIPVYAISESDTLRLDLEAVVSGHHQLELSTPSGRLSDEITEGKSKKIVLTVKNSGTLNLENLELSAQTPSKWNATFEPAHIDRMEPGQTQDVTATLIVPDKTIAGDYLTTFQVKSVQSSASSTFRMTVKTSLLSGWLGVLVIAAALGLVYYLIRKYGRR